MSLPYIVIPNPNGENPFRARVKLGAPVSENEFLTAVATDSGLTRAQVETCVRSLFSVAIGFLRIGRPLDYVLGLFRAFPSILGSFATNDPSAEEIKQGIHFTLPIGPDAEAMMTDGLSVEKVGESGTVAPEVESVVLSPGAQSNKYSLTAAMKVGGSAFRSSGSSQVWPAVALVLANGTDPKTLTVYACSQTEMLLSPAPAGTSGTRYLRITAGWNAGLITTYPTSLELF